MVGTSKDAVKASAFEGSGLVTIAKGILASYLLTIPLFLVFAFILSNMDFPETFITPAVIITTVISVLAAGMISTKGVKSKGWLNGGLVGLIYMLVLYLVSSAVLKDFSLNRQVVTMLMIGIFTGAIGGIMGINLRHGSNSRKSHRKLAK